MKDLRRNRLAELLASSRFNGDRAAFCNSAGITKGRLSQLLDPDEPFGDVAEKNLREHLNLPDGFFTRTTATANITLPGFNFSSSGSPSNQPLAPVLRAQAATDLVAQSKLCPLNSALETIAALMESLSESDKGAAESLLITMIRKPAIATQVIGAITALADSANQEEKQQAKQQPPVYRTGTHD